jgi:hypothetical protein
MAHTYIASFAPKSTPFRLQWTLESRLPGSSSLIEGLATAFIVVGVLILAGQAIDGIVKLHSFLQYVSSASRTIDRFLQSINQLIKLTEEVKTLLRSATDNSASLGTYLKSTVLEIQLEDCSKDVYHWLQLTRDYYPGSGVLRSGVEYSLMFVFGNEIT